LKGSSLRLGTLLAEQVVSPDLAFVNLDLTGRRSALDLYVQFAGQLRFGTATDWMFPTESHSISSFMALLLTL
jgi:hypothetical protein